MRGGAAKFKNLDGESFSLGGMLIVGKDEVGKGGVGKGGVGKGGVGKDDVGKDKKGGGGVTSSLVDGVDVSGGSVCEEGRVSEELVFAVVGAISILAVGNFRPGLIIRIPTAFTPGT